MSLSDEHRDCGGDAAAFVLGALEHGERAAFERHLAGCAICQDEVLSLNGVVDVLALTPPRYRPSKRLRRRVLGAIAAEARASSAARANPLGGIAGERRRPGWGSAGWLTGGGGPRWAPGLVGAAAAVALVLVVVVVGLTAGGSVRGHPSSGAKVWTASVGDAQIIVDAGHGELVVHHLGALDPGHTYEVWLERAGGDPQPTRDLFNVSPSGDGAIALPAGLGGVSTVMVTRERAGGSAVPTSSPLIVDHLS